MFSKEYYGRLYSLQDIVLGVIDALKTPFYLTGGTALSRFHYGHRYSDDLDFFSHSEDTFMEDVQKTIAGLKERKLSCELDRMTEEFARSTLLFSSKQETLHLKIDFVNENGRPRYGDLEHFSQFSRVDPPRNILSNKITAVSRQEPKDIVDIWMICRNMDFKWEEIIREAESKEAVEELLVERMLRTFPLDRLERIRWAEGAPISTFSEDREMILEDLICKRSNSLVRRLRASGDRLP